jgi:predicted O-linked N-acetylglucosamine transferase (SPINDLY family)
MLLGNVGDQSLKTSLTERFSRCGVAPERLLFQPRLGLNEYLALHHKVDMILDTFPYTGGTITNHALLMGVPVLTMTGPSSMQCLSAGMLGRAGLTEWIASDPEDFVQRARDWASRLPDLAKLRMKLRDCVMTSPLRRPETVARGVEMACRTMWERWCAGLAPEDFEIPLL